MSQAVMKLASQAQLQVGDGIVLRLPKGLDWNDDEFFEFCQANGDLRIERTANREIIIYHAANRRRNRQSERRNY